MTGRHIHLDAVGGVAGDMFVAALLDAMPASEARVREDLRAVLPAGIEWKLQPGMSGGLRALRFTVQGMAHDEAHPHAHGLGGFSAMMARIEGAPLHPGTAMQAGAILRVLGEAEAEIHGVPLAQVHFHEIADWDSLADVVAAGSLIASLAETVWTCSDLPRGAGMVRTAHGMLPVPAPATARILTGTVWRDDGVGGERVTPTGAAILSVLGLRQPGPRVATGRLMAVGSGAGTRELARMPNILRALVFETAAAPDAAERVAMISFDIDDMTGEELAAALDRIRGEPGVLDVSMAPALGKKGRPLAWVRVMARPDALDTVCRLCLVQTSTLGLRWRVEERAVLAREGREAEGLRVKTARRPDGALTAKVESDDLAGEQDLAARRRRQRQAEGEVAP